MAAEPSKDDFATSVKALAQSGSGFKFGKGVVGKTSIVMAAALPVLGVIAWRMPENWMAMGGFAILVVGLLAFWLSKVFSFADKHPAEALLEGAELLEWKSIEATKGGPVPDSPRIANPDLVIPRLSETEIRKPDEQEKMSGEERKAKK